MIGAPMVSTYKFFPRFQAVITRENPPWADKCSAGCKNCKVKILPQTAYYMFAGCAQRILRSWIVHPQNQRNSAAIWRPWPLARTSSRFRYGSTWYVSSLNMTRILPPYFWIFWSPAVFPLITAPNQSLNSDHSMPNWIMPKHPSSGIQVESSCFRCIWFRCQSCPPNWKFTNKQGQSGCFILWQHMGLSLHATHLKLRIHISNFSVFVVAGASYWAHPSYPLVNCHVTMNNHHFEWVNPLFLWPFNSYVTNYQRVVGGVITQVF